MKHRHRNFFSIIKNAVVLCSLFLFINCSAFSVYAQNSLTAADVRTIIAQAVSTAVALDKRVTVAVTDREGNVLGIFLMNGANGNSVISGGGNGGLEGFVAPSFFAAISKAGTPALFSTGGNAFSTRIGEFYHSGTFSAGH